MSSMIKEGRPHIYATELKIAVARDYLTSNLGYGRLAVKYNLPKATTVRGIVKWYRSRYPDILPKQALEDLVASPASVTDKQLQEANLKIAGLELLIANASKELGVDIVKKPGTKQLHK